MNEIYARIRGTAFRRIVKKAKSDRTQRLARFMDVGDRISKLLKPGAVLVEEFRDRGLRRGGRQQLNLRGAVADGDHRFAYALFRVLLDMYACRAQDVFVEAHGVVEVADGDADVVNT